MYLAPAWLGKPKLAVGTSGICVWLSCAEKSAVVLAAGRPLVKLFRFLRFVSLIIVASWQPVSLRRYLLDSTLPGSLRLALLVWSRVSGVEAKSYDSLLEG